MGEPESGYSRRRARPTGRLPNGVTLSALIMKVDAGARMLFCNSPSRGTFFLRAFAESFEFPDPRDGAARRRRLPAWMLGWRGAFCHGLYQKEADDSVTPVRGSISCRARWRSM